MKRVLTAVVLIPLVLWLVFKGPALVMLAVLVTISWLCLREYFAIVEAHGIRPFHRLTLLAVGASLIIPLVVGPPRFQQSDLYTYHAGPAVLLGFGICIGLIPIVLLTAGLWRESMSAVLPAAATSAFGILYIGVPLASLWALWRTPFGSLLVSYLLVVVWVGDIAAYFVGKRLGTRKLAPRVSPGKTWEGADASFIAAVVVGTAILTQLKPLYDWLAWYGIAWSGHWGAVSIPSKFPLWFAILASAFINIAAQLGDLAESAMKRGAGFKDSGNLLPGHGGMLDRVDALLGSSPLALLLLVFIGEQMFPLYFDPH